jgi:hypothetical protein
MFPRYVSAGAVGCVASFHSIIFLNPDCGNEKGAIVWRLFFCVGRILSRRLQCFANWMFLVGAVNAAEDGFQ